MSRIETPPVLQGTQTQQLKQIHSFLFRLSERLNVALNQIESGTAVDPQKRTINTVSNGKSSVIDVAKSYNELRALIANTGKIVKDEITIVEGEIERTENALSGEIDSVDRDLKAQIDGNYSSLYQQINGVASDFGTFEANFTTKVEETAANTIKSYGYDAKLSTLEEQAAGFSAYQEHTEGFIAQGFIDVDESGAPIVGVAIGEGLKTEEYVYNGRTYKKLNANQSCAFYLADRVSFRVNGKEVAYLSNKILWITDAVLTGTLQLGDNWRITGNPTFEIEFLGG